MSETPLTYNGQRVSPTQYLLSDKPVAYHPALARISGSVVAGVLLSQLCYWSPRATSPDGWFWKTQEEIEEETCISRHELDGAKKKLIGRGLIVAQVKGAPPKTFYKVNHEAIEEALVQQINLPKSGKLKFQKSEIQFAENRQIYNEAESTSENTSISSTVAVAPAAAKENQPPKEKPKEPSDPRVAETYKALESEWGAVPQNVPAEMKAIKTILRRGFQPPQILECYHWLKAQPFWADKFLSADQVGRQIGEMGKARAAPPSVNDHAPTPYGNPMQNLAPKRAPENVR